MLVRVSACVRARARDSRSCMRAGGVRAFALLACARTCRNYVAVSLFVFAHFGNVEIAAKINENFRVLSTAYEYEQQQQQREGPAVRVRGLPCCALAICTTP